MEALESTTKPTLPMELSVGELVARRDKIKEVMAKVMEEDVHYGVVPGTKKPTLLKPGAEVLCSVFMLDPEYDIAEKLTDGEHITITTRCTLFHIPTGLRVAAGLGSCSTKEEKYAFRFGKRVCPACTAEAISRSKEEWGGGWYCNKKAGGCGAKFGKGDESIEGQKDIGKVENDHLPDQYNTVLKMACKRSHVAATLNATGASDVFTQDLEDLAEGAAPQGARPAAETKPAETKKPPRQAARPQPPEPGDPFGSPEEAAGRAAPEKRNGQNGQEADDPRPALARRVVALRSGFKTQPNPQSWAAIVSYFATGAYLTGHEDRHTTAALAGVMKDDGQLQTMQVEHLEALAGFMRDLSSGEAKTVERLKTVILKPRG